MHRQRYLQLFTVLVTAGLASFVSTALGGIAWPTGLGIAATLMAASALVHLKMRALPARLYRACRVAMNASRVGGGRPALPGFPPNPRRTVREVFLHTALRPPTSRSHSRP